MKNLRTYLKELRKSKKGFTLTEILVVMSIIGIIVAMSMMYFSRNVDDAKVNVAKADARNILAAIVLYKSDVGKLPEGTGTNTLCDKLTKEEPNGRTGKVGPWMATCPKADPWGQEYKFDSTNVIVYTTVPTEVAVDGNSYITTKDLSKLQNAINPQ